MKSPEPQTIKFTEKVTEWMHNFAPKYMILYQIKEHTKQHGQSELMYDVVGGIVSELEEKFDTPTKKEKFYEMMNNMFENSIDTEKCVKTHRNRNTIFKDIMGYEFPSIDNFLKVNNKHIPFKPSEKDIKENEQSKNEDSKEKIKIQKIIEENNSLREELHKALQKWRIINK